MPASQQEVRPASDQPLCRPLANVWGDVWGDVTRLRQ